MATSFYILHLSDTHVIDDIPGSINGIGGDRDRGLSDLHRYAASTIEVINPRFVLLTGDVTELYNHKTSGGSQEETVRSINANLAGLNSIDVPTLMVTGNHDTGNVDWVNNTEVVQLWETMCSPLAYTAR